MRILGGCGCRPKGKSPSSRCCSSAAWRSRATSLKVGELRLDPARRQAWRGQQLLDLSAKEFALLELFLSHPGEVLTRTRILEHAWDFAFEPTSNVVDQYVGYLRRKIDRPFGKRNLETVRGVGYRLREPAGP